MHARVSTFESSPVGLRESEDVFRTEKVPAVLRIEGCRGVISLVDYESGKSIAVTFWEDEDALQASEELANRIRAESAEASSGRIAGVERFEVSILELRA
jgi:heme-degrading monooxygenase HmoA